MVKVTITSQGIIQSPGSGVEGSFTKRPSSTLTANTTLTAADAGVIILSASQGALTITLPTAADAIGSSFIFRTTSPSAHIITSSADVGNVIYTPSGTAIGVTGGLSLGALPGTNASKITFPAVVGSSACITSDGLGWGYHFGSGSLTFSKGAA